MTSRGVRNLSKAFKQQYLSDTESVAPLNFGLATSYHREQNRQAWRSLVEMAMSIRQRQTHDDDDDDELNLQPVHCKSNTLSVSSVTWPFNSKITCMQTT